MASELKPCAHCGSDDVLACYNHMGMSTTMHYYECSQCGIRTPAYHDRPDALAAWNRRSPITSAT